MIKKILILMSVLTLLFMAGCDKSGGNSAVQPTPPEENNENVDNNTDQDPTNPYNAEDLKEFIQQKYADAKEAFFWFTVDSMPPKEENVDFNSIKEVDGLYYYKVGHDTIKNMNDLEAYLKTLFSDKITKELLILNNNHYIDIDGELWAADAIRGADISVGNSIFTISEKNDSKIVYTANVEKLDPESGEVVGLDRYDYIYEKTDSGWRWTQFSVYE